MRRISVTAVSVCLLLAFAVVAHKHFLPHTVNPQAPPPEAAEVLAEANLHTYDEARQAAELTEIRGPLADYLAKQQGGQKGQPVQPESASSSEPVSGSLTDEDRVGDSPVGTSTPILHKTFSVTKAADLPFELPPHAATPQLCGSYRGFQKNGERAAVELMVMNESQYADLRAGKPANAEFSLDAAYNQEVNIGLPPTFSQGSKHYLVFRNASSHGTVNVKADLRIDF
jgi:hypothetical protein